ncbi:MAG: ankyrin repeat domain-containing protein [Pyrinomonadaceae bacterium]|nr:ankyrin repeat domain-containing protein [Pyrinomonadaceae bacterium]
MSAANRAAKLEHSTNESPHPAETRIPGKPEGHLDLAAAELTETDRGMTPLMRAACDGLAGTVRALLDRGADVNAKRSDGFNALALAAFFGHSQVVWLLLENGADLAATGRSETPPERWADARGFFEISETLRDARPTEQSTESSLSTAVIDESARFSRSAEKEELPPAGDPGTVMVIAEALNFEATLATVPALVVDESPATRCESRADVLPTDLPQHPRQQPVIEQRLRAPMTLPEIEDPPLLVVPKFHPGSVFFARVTSSWKNLAALILVVLLVGFGSATLLLPRIRKSLAEQLTQAASNTTNLPNQPPTNPVADSGTSASVIVENPAAPATEPTNAPAPKVIEEARADTFAAGPSVPRTGARPRKHRATPRPVEFKQQTVVEEPSQPAPLSVETSRIRNVGSAPAGSAAEVPISQTPPSSIISGKPKSKVIQWP